MTTQVSMPAPQEDQLLKILPIVGSALGSIGGPVGSAAGGAAGGMAQSLGQSPAQPGAVQTSGGNNSLAAAQRNLDRQNASADLRAGAEALAKASPEMQQQFAPVIKQAMDQSNPPHVQQRQLPLRMQ